MCSSTLRAYPHRSTPYSVWTALNSSSMLRGRFYRSTERQHSARRLCKNTRQPWRRM